MFEKGNLQSEPLWAPVLCVSAQFFGWVIIMRMRLSREIKGRRSAFPTAHARLCSPLHSDLCIHFLNVVHILEREALVELLSPSSCEDVS